MQVFVSASQMPLWQSVPTVHFRPLAQAPQTPPPQSMSVSSPSCRWSEHWLDTHVNVMPSHALLLQSESTRHPPPSAQGEQVDPPQSTPVSAPSFR